MTTDVFLTGVLAMCLAISWTEFLAAPGGLFEQFDTSTGRRLIDKLLSCPVCLSGQLACWIYVVRFFHSYDYFTHLLLISGTMVMCSIVVNRFVYEVE